jgi:hypothetical protein
MKWIKPILVASAVLGAIACGGKERKAAMGKNNPEPIVHEDTAGPAKFLRLPSPITRARWCEVPVVKPSRPDIGPTDKRLFVVVTVDSAHWPAWERALSKAAAHDTYFLSEDLATKLLPADWLAAVPQDSLGRGRSLQGIPYDPSAIATSWYRGVAAMRNGNHLFMEFVSR